MTNTIGLPSKDALARNLWQLEEERIGRERRITLRDQHILPGLRPGWWKRPVVWAVVFTGIFMARDAFATMLVELIVRTQY